MCVCACVRVHVLWHVLKPCPVALIEEGCARSSAVSAVVSGLVSSHFSQCDWARDYHALMTFPLPPGVPPPHLLCPSNLTPDPVIWNSVQQKQYAPQKKTCPHSSQGRGQVLVLVDTARSDGVQCTVRTVQDSLKERPTRTAPNQSLFSQHVWVSCC